MKTGKLLVLFFLFGMMACSDDDDANNGNENELPSDNNYHNSPVGASATDLLSASTFNSLVIDLVYVEGYAPTQETIDKTQAFLTAHLNKPSGISFELSQIESPGLAPYSLEDIHTIEKQYRTLTNHEDELAIFAFFADGSYASNESVLGVAYQNTSITLFESIIRENSGGLNQPSRSLLEATVVNHEFAHLLGLVNNGTPMQTNHQDEAHGHHCDNEDCLMYWTVETSDALSNLLGNSNPPPLGTDCQADIEASNEK